MNATINELSEICKKNRLTEKLLFAPSYSIGYQIGEWLAKTGNPWINLRMTTAAGYAYDRIAIRLNSEGIRLIESHERFLIVEKLFSDSRMGSRVRYFTSAAEIPGILKSLSDALHEIRMAGLTSADIDEAAFVVPDKGHDFKNLLAAYEEFLEQHRLIDHAGLLALALGEAEINAPEDAIVMTLTDFPLTYLEKALIDRVGQGHSTHIGHSVPVGLAIPTRFCAPVEENFAAEPKKDIDLLAWLPCPADAPCPARDGSVSVFRALGESNEVREVFRRVLLQGIPFDDVEIIVSEANPYLDLVYEVADSLNIPVTFGAGIPITYSRPGMALVLWLKWVSSDFAQNHLIRLFAGGYVDFKGFGNEDERPSYGRAAAILREAAIGWGRDRYEGRLEAIRESYIARAKAQREEGDEDAAQRTDRKAKKVEWIKGYIASLLGEVPVADQTGTVPAKEFYKAALNFLVTRCRVAGEQDAMAKTRLAELFETLINAPSVDDMPAKLSGRILEVVESLRIGQSNPKPGCVHVSHYRSGGWSGRMHTFVVGLDQGRFPGMITQNPIILDGERERLSPRLALSSELLHENSYLMAKMLASLAGEVTLSFSSRDLIENRELFPSSLVLNAYRIATGDTNADYTTLNQALGEPAGFLPSASDGALNHWEWWLSEGRQTSLDEDSIYSCYPFLLEGNRAEDARNATEITEYDGWVPSSKGDMDPCGPNLILSARKLEGLAKCPFAFFLENVLRIEPLQEMEQDPGKWLDAPQKGELLHEVFRRFMETISGVREKANFQFHWPLIERIALEEIERWKSVVPAGSASALDREVKDILHACSIFLKDEEERADAIQPLLFEVPFGMPTDKGEGFSQSEPIEMTIGGSGQFRLRGRIDRIDRCGEHKYEVWDYKTGSAWGYDEHKYLCGGRQLQHALYGVVAEFLLQERNDPEAVVVRTGYFFPSAKGEGLRIERRRAGKEELNRLLTSLFDLLRNGVFASSYDDKYCKYCLYASICGGPKAVERCQARIDSEVKLRSLMELKTYE